jgi:hypothetical protein
MSILCPIFGPCAPFSQGVALQIFLHLFIPHSYIPSFSSIIHSSIHSFFNSLVCSEFFLTPTFYYYYFPGIQLSCISSFIHSFIHWFIHSFCYILQVTSDSSLSVIAQTFMDSCSLNENILGKSPQKTFRGFQSNKC